MENIKNSKTGDGQKKNIHDIDILVDKSLAISGITDCMKEDDPLKEVAEQIARDFVDEAASIAQDIATPQS